MIFVWVVKKRRQRVFMQFFSEAWADWKSHEGEIRFIFPLLISKRKFYGLKDFGGW